MSYSDRASSALVSFTATTYPLRCTNRTRWREMPFGSATIVSSGQASRGRSHGRSSRPGSTVAAVMVMESGTAGSSGYWDENGREARCQLAPRLL